MSKFKFHINFRKNTISSQSIWHILQNERKRARHIQKQSNRLWSGSVALYGTVQQNRYAMMMQITITRSASNPGHPGTPGYLVPCFLTHISSTYHENATRFRLKLLRRQAHLADHNVDANYRGILQWFLRSVERNESSFRKKM